MKEYEFLEEIGPVLVLDIGSGTQDVLLASAHVAPENWPQFVLPSPARLIAQQVENLTQQKKAIWLYGHNMGGGFFKAVRAHLQSGLAVFCTTEAAAAVHDSLEHVQAHGIEICETAPQNAVPVHLADYASAQWQNTLRQWGLPMPYKVVAAVQDHGIFVEGNRLGRMQLWRTLLEEDNTPEHWLFTDVPAPYTRLSTLQKLTGGPVADTGTAAILGALSMPEVRARSQREGVTLINVGNSHILAMLIYAGKVVGIFEHHTGQQRLEDYLHDLHEFRMGWLPDEQVRASGGHGVALGARIEDAGAFTPTFIMGPQREMLRGHGQFLAPHGQMMLAGCFGLLWALGAQYSNK